jgi:hypothetical protein
VGEDGLLRLEAAMLAEGAVQPWPATLVTLATGAGEQFAVGTVNAYAALAKGLVWRDPFSVGAQVLALTYSAGGNVGHWTAGAVSRKLAGRRYDVRLVDGDMMRNMRQQYVVTPSTGGAGAVLREAAQMGSAELVGALLRKGISVFESDHEAITPLHLASASGHADVCNLLVEAGADGLIPDMRGLTSYDLAISNRHTAVRQIFEPTASDEGALWRAKHTSVVCRCATMPSCVPRRLCAGRQI